MMENKWTLEYFKVYHKYYIIHSCDKDYGCVSFSKKLEVGSTYGNCMGCDQKAPQHLIIQMELLNGK